ncbi:MAG: histidine phosphatase family protein [Bacteroidia bacterium]|nr:histidine phosphatase family protein [Bacteroidia bacterium]
MKLLIVRHSETIENIQRICQGQTHGTLSDKGVEEAKKTGLRLKLFSIDCCYTSDLHRATDTARYIAEINPNLVVCKDIRLRERYFGSFQGQVFPESLSNFIPPEETETVEAIAARLLDFLSDIKHRHPHQTVLVVSHGFTIRVLISIFMNLPATGLETLDDIENASLSIVDIQNESYQISLLNDTSHLTKN